MTENSPEIFAHYRKISESNRVLMINHADLMDTGFTPQLIRPDDDYFLKNGQRIPMELKPGKSWYDLLKDDKQPIDLHLKIALTAAEQMQRLIKEKGLLILDRCEVNIFVANSDNKAGEIRVSHIDLEDLYDYRLGGIRTNKVSPAAEFAVDMLDYPEEREAFNIAAVIRHNVLPKDSPSKSIANFRKNWSYTSEFPKGIGGFQALINDLTAISVELKVGV